MVLKNYREGKILVQWQRVLSKLIELPQCLLWNSYTHEKMWREQNTCAYIEILNHFSSNYALSHFEDLAIIVLQVTHFMGVVFKHLGNPLFFHFREKKCLFSCQISCTPEIWLSWSFFSALYNLSEAILGVRLKLYHFSYSSSINRSFSP